MAIEFDIGEIGVVRIDPGDLHEIGLFTHRTYVCDTRSHFLDQEGSLVLNELAAPRQ